MSVDDFKNRPFGLDALENNRWALTDLIKISTGRALQIAADLGDGNADIAKKRIVEDPYSLLEVDGIGFKIADDNALIRFDLSKDDPRRHGAGNVFILERGDFGEDSGVMPLFKFREKRRQFELLNPTLEFEKVSLEGDRVWLQEELHAEKDLARWLGDQRNLELGKCDSLRPSEEKYLASRNLDPHQENAVLCGLESKVLLITGGAGTGKSRSLATLTKLAQMRGRTVRLMAFAGKAADRLAEVLQADDIEAPSSTIHRALKATGSDSFNLGNFTEDIIIIDECSMIHNRLLHAVVSRLGSRTQLILVGDDGQLPPIGYGFPFCDFLAAGLPHAHLKQNHRQKDVQGILQLATGIREQQPIDLDPACISGILSIEDVVSTVKQITPNADPNQFPNWQVVTWKRADVDLLNEEIQAFCNPHGEVLARIALWDRGTIKTARGKNAPEFYREIRVGDKVLIKKNNNKEKYYNGQMGRAVGIETLGVLEVQFLTEGEFGRSKSLRKIPASATWEESLECDWDEDKRLVYVYSDSEFAEYIVVERFGERGKAFIAYEGFESQLALGYAITAHSSQGSDWDSVLVVSPDGISFKSAANRWWYTAVTRAKAHLYLLSELDIGKFWTNAITKVPERRTTLTIRLQNYLRSLSAGD